ncbi:hypothetical protein [Jannaschia seohaensis]|uniref:Uncharacterized protein n=1 Tax=Jannaschia seohaensis TaxID=475081 RepID=A0A2Y9AN84_9RHOB|nr:hypothetical protein [Jannaschia seohaensis]PWJ19269.1 hypothetical protein BCF38_104203 [Jannaschia seohaensis]SSA45931.1 hypothetical protein SAMN05421539_104203 [Jannaschia seohaensis]
MRFLLISLAACTLAAPAMAQKFVSVTGETTRTTIGAATATEAAAEETEAAAVEDEMPVEEADGEQVADAAEEETVEQPAVIEFGVPVQTLVPNGSACNPGTIWNQWTGRCETS